LASATLKAQRRWYAEEIRWSAKLRSARLVEALASVPREGFLGRGPWQILGDKAFDRGYAKTGNPRHLYHNVLVAIDARRRPRLNNGLPSFLASLIDQLDLKQGETVCHVGCGTGYYSAIMAEIVGKRGRVIAVEVDQALARRSRRNLRRYRQVDVIEADGFAHDPGKVDAILVNAGVTHLSQQWLQNLNRRGRLVAPLTLENQFGRLLKTTRNGSKWIAGFVSPVGIYPCMGGRSKVAEALLGKAFAGGGAEEVRSLRRDKHVRGRDCWLHGQDFCLSRRKP
jgi:protein-L-isoaspartate(D-aspartate) O-methyltransferase